MGTDAIDLATKNRHYPPHGKHHMLPILRQPTHPASHAQSTPRPEGLLEISWNFGLGDPRRPGCGGAVRGGPGPAAGRPRAARWGGDSCGLFPPAGAASRGEGSGQAHDRQGNKSRFGLAHKPGGGDGPETPDRGERWCRFSTNLFPQRPSPPRTGELANLHRNGPKSGRSHPPLPAEYLIEGWRADMGRICSLGPGMVWTRLPPAPWGRPG